MTFICDILLERERRQTENYTKALRGRFEKDYNPKALKRFLKYTKWTKEQVLADKGMHRAAAFATAVEATRQGGLDETYIINGINDEYKNIDVLPLPNTKYRPMNDGRVLTQKQMKEEGLTKTDGLKTFDIRITGNLTGWGTAKVKKGKGAGGGHQGNVEREIIEFIEWANQHGKDDLIYVALIDGDHERAPLEAVRKWDNIWIVDHIELQERLNEYE